MSVTDQPQQQDELLLEEAMDWLMRLRDAPTDPELITEWESWLQASDAHATAWTRICRTWAALGEGPTASPAPDARSPTHRALHRATDAERHQRAQFPRRSFGLAAAALLSIAIVASVFGPDLRIRMEADFRTGTGETEMVTLADGSRVTLAPQTALADDFDGLSRQVRLLSGEAYFEVERDAERPFVVEARDASVRVLGTAFSVRDTGQGTRVELAHGAIALSVQGAANGDEIVLAPGDVVTVDRRQGKAERSHVDPGEIALWREGRLSVTDQAFADVVGLIQRQHDAWIVVADSSVASLRVTGLYDLDDPDKALSALAAPFGLKVRAVSPYLRVISQY